MIVDRTMGPWIGHNADVTSNPSDLRFWIRMSDDGVEVEAHSYEEMRNLDTSYCLCA